MTIGERIKEVRTSNNLTLEKFGAKIKIRAASVSLIERGINNPSDQTISLICREFGVSEQWLRTGEGDQHATLTRTEEIERVLSVALKSEPTSIIRRMISALSKLDESDWEALGKVWDKITGHAAAESAHAPEPRNVHDWTREEMDAEYKRQADAEEADQKKGATESSTGSPNVSGADCA